VETFNQDGTLNLDTLTTESAAVFVDEKCQPSCSCTETNNLDEVDPAGFYVSSLIVQVQWSCANGCSTCLASAGDCAVFDSEFDLDLEGIEGDFTLEELLGGALDPETGVSAFLTGGQTISLCCEWREGALSGVACFRQLVDASNLGDAGSVGDAPCELTHSDVACNSFASSNEPNCIIGDISSVDTCLDGVFQALSYFA